MISLAKSLVFIGLVLVLLGGLVYLLARAGVQPGRLPGDIKIVRENSTCIIALGTSIILSLLLTVILNVVFRLLKR